MASATEHRLESLIQELDLGKVFEVVGDQVVETSAMGAFEAALASLLQELMGSFTRTNRLGRVVTEMLFDLRPAVDCQRRPDVAFVSTDRWPLGKPVPRTQAWDVIPDLAVEVVSTSNTATEIMTKVEEYFAAGVRRVWSIYPDQHKVYDYDSTTALRILTPDDTLEGGPLLPGFQLPLRWLFAEAGEPTL